MEYIRFGSKMILRLDKGEEILTSLRQLCTEHDIKLGTVSGLGAVNKISVGLFRQETKEYITKEMTGDMEITSLVGNITRKNGQVYIHLHMLVTDDTFKACGGHLNYGWVGATSELIIDVIDGHVDRLFSEEIGLNLLEFEQTASLKPCHDNDQANPKHCEECRIQECGDCNYN